MTSNGNAVELRQVSKRFPNPFSFYARVCAVIDSFFGTDFSKSGGIVAVDEISFVIRKGESFGIIGRNGAGKSTLLQMIAGTLQPTSGTISVSGRVNALLELGSGFNPEFTGRENVFMNGTILGLSNEEIERQMKSIMEFAEIGEFIDLPVKTYSSGMYVRLAFSVQAQFHPEILIVDEALSVGDHFFTKKCFEKLRELKGNGSTLIFVSHDLGAFQNLCDRGVLLDGGKIIFDGSPVDCVSRFYSLSPSRASDLRVIDCSSSPTGNVRNSRIMVHGIGGLQFDVVSSKNDQGQETRDYRIGDLFKIQSVVRVTQPIIAPIFGLQIYDRYNNIVFGTNTAMNGLSLQNLIVGEVIEIEWEIELRVGPGEYSFALGCSGETTFGEREQILRIEPLGPIKVHPRNETPTFNGMFKMDCRVTIEVT